MNQILYNRIDDGYGYLQFFRVVAIGDGFVELVLMDKATRGQGVVANYVSIDHCRPVIIASKDSRNSLIIYLGEYRALTSKFDLPIVPEHSPTEYFDLNEFGRYDGFTDLRREEFSRLWGVWDKRNVQINTSRHWQPHPGWQSFYDDEFDADLETPGLDFDSIDEL